MTTNKDLDTRNYNGNYWVECSASGRTMFYHHPKAMILNYSNEECYKQAQKDVEFHHTN